MRRAVFALQCFRWLGTTSRMCFARPALHKYHPPLVSSPLTRQVLAFEVSEKSAQALEASIVFNAFGSLVRLQKVALGETAFDRVKAALPEGAWSETCFGWWRWKKPGLLMEQLWA